MDSRYRFDGRIPCLVVMVSAQLLASVWCTTVPLSTVPKSTNAKLLMDVVRLLSGSSQTPAAVQDNAEKPGQRCQLTEVSACFNSGLEKFYKSILTDEQTDLKVTICSLAGDLETCNGILQPGCRLKDALNVDAILKGSRYFCTVQGYSNYLGMVPCLANTHVINDLQLCKHKLTSWPTTGDACKLFDGYIACAVNATRTSCAADAEDTLTEALNVMLMPYREALCGAGQSETRSATESLSTHRNNVPSRNRREAGDGGSLFGGGSLFDGLAGSSNFSPSDLFWRQMITGSGASSGEAAATSPWSTGRQAATQPSIFTIPEFPWDLLARLSQVSGQGTASSEEVTMMPTDVVTPEGNSEEVTVSPQESTTPEISSEEVNTAAPDTTTHEDSSEEEVSTASPDTTTQADSSEEEATTSSLDTTIAEADSEEAPETTTAPRIVPEGTAAPEVVRATATTRPGNQVAPFQCYECHSGAIGDWQNKLCPPNGNIQGWAALPQTCYGPCVSIVTKYPKGEVYRSCSTQYYFSFRVPYDGCVRYNKELYCFCSGDLCNNKNMVTDQQAYIFEGLISNL